MFGILKKGNWRRCLHLGNVLLPNFKRCRSLNLKALQFTLLFFLSFFTLPVLHAQEIAKSQRSELRESKNSIVKYTENKGQWDDRVQFKTAVSGTSVFLERDGFTFVVSSTDDLMEAHRVNISGGNIEELSIRKHAFKMEFVNCNVVEPIGKDYYLDY